MREALALAEDPSPTDQASTTEGTAQNAVTSVPLEDGQLGEQCTPTTVFYRVTFQIDPSLRNQRRCIEKGKITKITQSLLAKKKAQRI